MNLKELFEKAEELGHYLVTMTTLDKSKEENNLEHYVIRQEFPLDDVIPSIDNALRSMNIKPPVPIPVTESPAVVEPQKPLKIAIITHFNRCPDSYSPGHQVKSQIKMLQQFGHEVVFFTQAGSKLTKEEIGCEVRPVVSAFKREKNIINEEMKQKFIDVLREQLTSDFDVAVTHDFYIDDCITYREAVRECGVPIRWLHWARSGVGHPIEWSMPNSLYVYMNKTDVGTFAKMINVDPSLVRVVYNDKDPSILFDWDLITKTINNKMRLWEKDVIQTYGVCTTRFSAKGIDSVIRTFGALKRQGLSVALIICNSNGRRRVDEIKAKMEFALSEGLNENDILFTSTLPEELGTASEVPHRVVMQLMQISNLFVFATIAEVGPNLLLESGITKNLLVLNEDLPLLYDFVDREKTISFPFTSSQSIHYKGRDDESMAVLAKQIKGQLKSNKADMAFRQIWKNHNLETIYKTQLEPILYEEIK